MRKRPNDVEKLDRISDAMDADKQGNVEVGKNLKIDGNLQFSSLVSKDNPNGIFDPSSGGTGGGGTGNLYRHLITMNALTGLFCITYYGTESNKLTYAQFNNILDKGGIACSGITKGGDPKIALSVNHKNKDQISVSCVQINTGDNWDITIDDSYVFSDIVAQVY